MSDGGEDSPPPPRRKIKRIVLASSSSDSESDDSGPATSTRKKRLRVLSDEESESSGSSVALSRRRRRLPQLRDSGDSDTSGWATDHSDVPKDTSAAAQAAKTAAGFASDSSEGNSEKCSICLLRFTDQQVGTPQSCEHIFCLDCITEWSKNVNTCPVDRMTFESIVVRTCAGGRVLCTQPVHVVERRPSVEMLVVEDHTVCEICGSMTNEETMLLCDGCDLGYHMQCLDPPLSQVPIHAWYCPGCIANNVHYRRSQLELERLGEEAPFFRVSEEEEEMMGAEVGVGGWRSRAGAGAGAGAGASSSRGAPPASRARAPAPRRAAPARRKRARRTATVIVEYELQEDGKCPVTRRVKRKIKRRKIKKRRPRTAARRTHVRESVRARLAALRTERAHAHAHTHAHAQALGTLRQRAGIPSLSLFGSRHELDYFSEEEGAASEGASTAVAARAAPLLSARGQARRKMISIASPPHAAAAPDLLSGILASQTLLHSRDSVVSVTVDGDVDIKLHTRSRRPPAPAPPARAVPEREERLDVAKGGSGSARKAPAYPGQSRGGGGWGGGYRYPREQPPAAAGAAYTRAPDNGYGPAPHAPGRRDDGPAAYGRAPPPLAHDERARRRHDARPPRRSGGPAWRPPVAPHRSSFGGFENALDMRVGGAPRPPAPGPASFVDEGGARPFGPLPEPPTFRFEPAPSEEDERSDSSLVIDTEKYDPTEPTDDDEEAGGGPPPPLPPPPAPPLADCVLSELGAGALGVSAAALDDAVRAVLRDHRALLAPRGPDPDDDDDGHGACPNFSIYSATSVHIASDASAGLAPDPAPAPAPEDEAPPPPSPPPALDPEKRKSDEYNEKVSKRCPITTNTRNPIKIKLNAPSLIRRQVSLYDEEDGEAGEEPEAAAAPAPDAPRDGDGEGAGGAGPTEPAEEEEEPEEEEERPEEEAEEPEEEAADDDAAATVESPAEVEEGESVERDGGRTPSIPDDGPPEGAEPSRAEPERSEGECADDDERSERERSASPASPRSPPRAATLEKMTESISETEDERSYTPCLDEQRDHDEPAGLEGLDTELISEDEGHEMFSDEARAASPPDAPRPPLDDAKKKRKRESKKDGKEKRSKLKKADVAFKKVGKGKERNYREREKDDDKKRERRDSAESERARRKKEKRKDLERYDVRTLVSEKRRRTKDAFGRDVSPRGSPSPSPSPRRSLSATPPRRRAEPEPPRRRASSSPRRRAEPPPEPPSPRRRRRRSASRKRAEPRRRRDGSRARKRRRSGDPSPKPKAKKKKRARSERPRSRSRSRSPRRKSPKRKRVRRRSESRRSPAAAAAPAPAAWSPRPDSRPPSPRTPPAPEPPPPIEERRARKRRDRSKHRRLEAQNGPSKEVFTSGDNILVSVSFKEQQQEDGATRRSRRRERRRRRRRAAGADDAAKPVAIIDLERSPFRELTPSPKNVIVLSDDEAGGAPAPAPPAPEPAGPKTPPSPRAAAAPPPAAAPAAPAASPRGPNTPPEPPDSPDAYDPYEPTASPSPPPASPPRASMTLEAAQKTNMSADEVLDRRPLSPIEKVMALLQSTRDVSPEPPPEGGASAAGGAGAGGAEAGAGAGAGGAARVLLPEAARAAPPKLFLAKPSPIKSDPIKPMQQATKISRLPLPGAGRGGGGGGAAGGESPYSPGSSDFGELFSPPPGARRDSFDALFDKPPGKGKKRAARTSGKLKKKGKTQVDVKIDDDNLKILDELPSSAVEMQVKSKVSNFLKKLNRQERVVEEVKLVLKPHYNKKHVSKDEYKHILRRTVPKICHNKTGEINPTKIQALVEAYVKKFRKRRKLGLA